MFAENYTDTVMDHFICPRNAGVANNVSGEGLLEMKGVVIK